MGETAIDVGYSDFSSAPEREAAEPIPPANYDMQIVEAEVKTTTTGGRMLSYKAEVLGGQFERRKVFGNINIINANETAQKIGQAELAELSKAIGLPEMPRDTSQLLYTPFTAKVTIAPARVDKDTGKAYRAKNEIAKFMLYGGGEVASSRPAGQPAGQSAAQPAATGKPATSSRPWENK